MTRHERKLRNLTLLAGSILTGAVVLGDLAGLLQPLEWLMVDRRALWCQSFTPPPTDKLLHLDIDDTALTNVGAWPWPRTHLARIMREVQDAGAATVMLDILFLEPQPPRFEVRPDGSPGELIDDDAVLARQLADMGHVIVPLNLMLEPAAEADRGDDPVYRVLLEDVTLTREQVIERLRGEGLEPERVERLLSGDEYLRVRREVLFDLIGRVKRKEPSTDRDATFQLVAPNAPRGLTTPMSREFDRQLDQYESLATLDRFARPREDGLTYPPLPAKGHQAPLAPFGKAAVATGFVNYLPLGDGSVRTVPMYAEYRGRLYPQVGLVIACLMLQADPKLIAIHDDYLSIPRAGGEPIRLPVHAHHVRDAGRTFGLFMDIPWVGTSDYTRMYDYPEHRRQVNHLSMNLVWDVVQTRDRMRRNVVEVGDTAMKDFYDVYDQDKARLLTESPLPPEDLQSRIDRIDEILGDSFNVEAARDAIPIRARGPKTDDDVKAIKGLDAFEALQHIRREHDALTEQLNRQRAILAEHMKGKAVIVGWTATSVIADFINTSLGARWPGAVVHGAIYNAIMTEHLLTTMPRWVTLMVTLMIGLAITLAVATLSPAWALAAMGLGLCYLPFNGVVLYDWGDCVVGMAAPMLAVLVPWAGCTLFRFVTERRERARITKRFQSYVDPTLVEYVIEHAEQTTLTGQIKELTVVFTDLAGFTTVSERLGPATVPLLNEYMGKMVPIIRGHGGYVNKFLGDGIMFFYGAPRGLDTHADAAVDTVLKMQEELVEFNAHLESQGLPTVKMRAGVCTGLMVVGDAGPPDAADYTVLGDTVNTAARLESANKATDTLIMLSARTVELLSPRFLVRPLAKLRVVGKTEGVMTYEPLGYLDQATDEQRQLASLTTRMVEEFLGARFRPCIDVVNDLERQFGRTKLTAMYRHLSDQYLSEMPGDFDGAITLESK